MVTIKTGYIVKEKLNGWKSFHFDTLEEAQAELLRVRDRAGMVEWKTRPAHEYVVIKQETVITETIS